MPPEAGSRDNRRKEKTLPVYTQSYIYVSVPRDLFQTLADPTRRRIVELLGDDEQSVNDLVALVGIHQSGVSRHLRILHEAGFVGVRPQGTRRIYSLRPEPFRALDDWVGHYRDLGEARLERFAVALDQAQRAPADSPSEEAT